MERIRMEPGTEIGLLEKTLEVSSSSIVFTDRAGKITYVNSTFLRKTGYTREEVVGRNPRVLKSGKQPPEVYAELWKTISSGDTWTGRLQNRRKDGSLFWEQATIFPVMDAGGAITHFVAIKEDITPQKRADDVLACVATANRLLLESSNLDETVRRVLQLFGDACEVDRAYYFSFHEPSAGSKGAYLRHEEEWNSGRFAPQIDNPELEKLGADDGLLREWVERFKQRKTVAARVADLPEPERSLLAKQDIRSLLLVPVHSGERLFGLVGFDDCREERDWPAREITLLHSVASSIGIVLQRKRYEAEIQQAFLKAEESALAALEANSAKSAFLATMSHEIRTPLNGILGMTQIMLEDDVSEEHRDFLRTIHRCGENLGNLLNDVLDLAKIEAGKLNLQARRFSLPTLVREVVDLYRPRASEKGLTLAWSRAEDLPPSLGGDPDRVRQIVVNLVSNAVKFTETGSVSVRLSRGDGEDAPVRISVEDTGIGIRDEDAGRLFQMFTQGDSSTTRKYGGTGLGLAISRRLAEAMGGRIWFESQPGHGSVFHVELPDHACPAPEAPAEAGPEAAETAPDEPAEWGRNGLGPPKILLVEDNKVNQRVTELQLKSLGLSCRTVADGEEALATYGAEGPFDLVLMDCQLPRLNGFDATARLLRENDSGTPPIIALTAAATDSDHRRAREAGMVDYLVKPVTKDRLRSVIVRHLPDADGS